MLTFGMKSYWVYILASRPHGTLYVGMTNDLVRRIYQHREGLVEGFSREHGVKMLVYTSNMPLRSLHPTGKEYQTLVAGVEGRPHSDAESGLARFMGRHHTLTCPPDWPKVSMDRRVKPGSDERQGPRHFRRPALDKCPHFSYTPDIESRSPKGAFRMRSRCRASAVPARGFANRSRAALGHRSAGKTTGLRGAR
jgi:hypothetical protein